jgi:integrase
MKGSRPLADTEVAQVAKSFSGVYATRNKAMFLVGHRTGFRISELLSIRVGDVWQHSKSTEQLTVQRRHMKGGKAGKTSSRTVRLHPEAKAALSVWLEILQKRLGGTLDPQTPVFCSRVKDPTTGLKRPISRVQAWRILQEAYLSNELPGKLGTHAMRKTFANRVYELLNHDLVKTQRALGHANINSTVQYLSFREEEIDAAILAA